MDVYLQFGKIMRFIMMHISKLLLPFRFIKIIFLHQVQMGQLESLISLILRILNLHKINLNRNCPLETLK